MHEKECLPTLRKLLFLLAFIYAPLTRGQVTTNIISSITFGCSYDDVINAFVIDNAGNIVGAGFSSFYCSYISDSNSFGRYDGWVIKLDTAGNKIWSTTLGGPNNKPPSKILK